MEIQRRKGVLEMRANPVKSPMMMAMIVETTEISRVRSNPLASNPAFQAPASSW